MDGKDKIPVQADGEAWLQDPGVITISHKNKARMVIRDKVRVHKIDPHFSTYLCHIPQLFITVV